MVEDWPTIPHKIRGVPRSSAWKRLEEVTDHPILGYAIMIAIIVGMFYSIFTFGDYTSKLLGATFDFLKASYYSALGSESLQVFRAHAPLA
jgi:Fe2+ transport system protein B